MENVKLSNVVEMAQKLVDLEGVKLELKRVQSVKCRLKKQKAKKTYEAEMTEVVKMEQLLKEVREYFEPKKPTVTTITQEQIDLLNFDETIKAIKSIQSKKCNTQWLMENQEENVEYQDALRIEKLLLEHKKTVKPVEDTVVKKSDLQARIDHIKTLNLSPEEMLAKIQELI